MLKVFVRVVLLCLGAFQGAVLADGGEPSESLLDWLNKVNRSGYRLISAVDEQGAYFAVFFGEKGDILLCNRCNRQDSRGSDEPEVRLINPTGEVGVPEFTGWAMREWIEEVGPRGNTARSSQRECDGALYRMDKAYKGPIRVMYYLDVGGKKVDIFDRKLMYPSWTSETPEE